MIRLETILVPIDFSAHANQALKYACALAVKFHAHLHLLNVVQPLAVDIPYAGAMSDELLHPETSAKEQLDQIEVPQADDVNGIEREVRSGPPFVEIVRYAKEKSIDLIVMGTHGRSGLTHALLGSVAEKVVRKASCPVLTVRLEGHQFIMP